LIGDGDGRIHKGLKSLGGGVKEPELDLRPIGRKEHNPEMRGTANRRSLGRRWLSAPGERDLVC
jgi:hypothetical protein